MASRLLSTTLIRPPAPACFRAFPTRIGARKGTAKFSATSDGSQGSVDGTVYQGVYGPWTIEPSDVREEVSSIILEKLVSAGIRDEHVVL